MGRKYAAPPLFEALVEFSFSGSKWDSTIPGLFFERIKNSYPTISRSKAPNSSNERDERTIFHSNKGNQVIQIGRDILVINHLRPYPEKFENWTPEIFQILSHYLALVSPSNFQNIGVRFLNKIEVPGTQFPMEKYFRLFPSFSKELAASHGDFLLRVVIEPKIKEHNLLITFSGEDPARIGFGNFLLDLYDQTNVTTLDLKMIERIVYEGHENVEHAFENIVTDESRLIFKEIK